MEYQTFPVRNSVCLSGTKNTDQTVMCSDLNDKPNIIDTKPQDCYNSNNTLKTNEIQNQPELNPLVNS